MTWKTLALTLAALGSTPLISQPALASPELVEIELVSQLRVATFNVSMNRRNEGELATELEDLASPSAQAQAIAEIIQRIDADIILLNEFDYDAQGRSVDAFRRNYLEQSQNGQAAVHYPFAYFAPVNTGVQSGLDLNNDGSVGGPNDAYGFGFFPGQYGMVVLSKHVILDPLVRTFQNFLWKDMPNALLPDNPDTDLPQDWYSPQALEKFRLSSKSHWDIPIWADAGIIHVLASHPTPPVFDGPEDRNGRRNHDEIRFWRDYIEGGAQAAYIYDDNGLPGGLWGKRNFVVMGDLNADPNDGDSTNNPMAMLLNNRHVNSSQAPTSQGGVAASLAQGGANQSHQGDPAKDTADFSDRAPGNLRVDYILPSRSYEIQKAEVFWPTPDAPEFDLVGNYPFPSSDHRALFMDLRLSHGSFRYRRYPRFRRFRNR